MYKGYCIADIGGVDETMPPVHFNDLESAMRYVMLQKKLFKEVIIEDHEEYCILHAVNGKIVFPEQFAGR